MIVSWGQILTTVKMHEPDRRRRSSRRRSSRARSGASRARRRSAHRACSAASTRPSPPRATTRRSSSSTRARASSRASAAGCARRPTSRPRARTARRRGAGSRRRAPPRLRADSQGMDWNQLLLFAILGLGTGSLIAGIALGDRPDLSRLGDHQSRDRCRSRCSAATRTGRSRPASLRLGRADGARR